MAGKHRAKTHHTPAPRFVVGAVTASVLVTAGSTALMPATPPALATPPPPPVSLPMPLMSLSLAALYLPALTPAPVTHPTDAPAEVKHAAFTVHTAGTTGGLATRAVSAAMSQQGVPYVYGGTTPGRALDCSALVQYAYRSAGITLPRTAGAQASVGRTVRLADIQPGDLLFFYSPITHVAVAIGNGKIIEASQPGQPVAVHNLYTDGLAVIKRVTG
jgi:cell wall-associated NlpC family hydrolase